LQARKGSNGERERERERERRERERERERERWEEPSLPELWKERAPSLFPR
jgi:hypothetical protein